MIDLAKTVTERMTELGMKPVEVAAASGVGYNTVLNVMKGYSRGQYATIEAIMEALELELVVQEKDGSPY